MPSAVTARLCFAQVTGSFWASAFHLFVGGGFCFCLFGVIPWPQDGDFILKTFRIVGIFLSGCEFLH